MQNIVNQTSLADRDYCKTAPLNNPLICVNNLRLFSDYFGNFFGNFSTLTCNQMKQNKPLRIDKGLKNRKG